MSTMHAAENSHGDRDGLSDKARKLAARAGVPTVRTAFALAAAGVFAWPTAAAAQQITIKEFPLPASTTSRNPWGITAGPGAAMWFTEANIGTDGYGARIGSITTDGFGTVNEYGGLNRNAEPTSIAFARGLDGNLWFTDQGTAPGSIGRITPQGTGVMEYPVNPTGTTITVGPDQALWFTAGDQIGRITTGGSPTYPVQLSPESNAAGIVLGPDNALWFTESSANKIGRYDPVTKVLSEFPLKTAHAAPTAIAVGPDNALWFTEFNAAGNNIGRIPTSATAQDPQITEVSIPTANAGPNSIAAGPDCALWFTEGTASKIGRLDVNTQVAIDQRTTTLGSNPQGIALGPDGALWFTEGNVDPSTGLNHVGRVPAANSPCGGARHAAHDFNGDGISDILWRNTTSNLAVWLMNNGAVLQSAALSTVTSAFTIIGQHDFNGDGKADILWRDTSGNISMWFMNGAAVGSAAAVSNVTSNWTLYGTGDLNGDGKGDLLWRDAITGNVAVWFMNGSLVASTGSLGTLPSTWTIEGDANGSILLRDGSGDIALWGIKNGQIASSHGLGTVSGNFVVQGIGDFNGDGFIDILWRDTNTGTISIWFTNGTQVTSAAVVSAVPSSWTIAQVGDYNGDGKSDILWIDSSGDLAVWLMNGSIVSSSLAVSNVGKTWTVQNLNAQ